MIAISLAFIQKEMMLYIAMEYLAGSPLREAILRPEPRHFVKTDSNSLFSIESQVSVDNFIVLIHIIKIFLVWS